jgi:hypothetical protein
VHDRLLTVDRDDDDRYATWLLGGAEGDEPERQKPLLEAECDRLASEIAGARAAVNKVLKARADHVDRHRKRLVKDVDGAVAEARDRYEQALREAEQARQELVELREAAIWAQLYPDCRESDIRLADTVAGGQRKRLSPAGLTAEIKPAHAFALLRSDAEWLSEAIPAHSQLARDRLRGEEQTDITVWTPPRKGSAGGESRTARSGKRSSERRSQVQDGATSQHRPTRACTGASRVGPNRCRSSPPAAW